MTERRRLDDMTDDQLEELYADLDRARTVAVALEQELAHAAQQLAAVPHASTLLWAADRLDAAAQPLAALELRDWAQRDREDGHTGACAATEATNAPEPTETANGPHTPAQRP